MQPDHGQTCSTNNDAVFRNHNIALEKHRTKHHSWMKGRLRSGPQNNVIIPLSPCPQACPYVICLFFVPCHYYTHMVMFTFTAIWATNIHDAVPGNTEPIMGAKYHTASLVHDLGRTFCPVCSSRGFFHAFCSYFDLLGGIRLFCLSHPLF